MSKAITWTNATRRLGDLKVWDKNPMVISDTVFEMLGKQIKGFGFTTPMLINTDDTIIAGHQRRKRLLKDYGEDYQVDVRYPSRKLTQREFEDLALGDNLNKAAFDFEQLNINFDVDDLLGIGFDKLDLNIDLDYSGNNKEVDVDGFEDKSILKLEYTLEDYSKVKQALAQIADTPEKALWQLLKL